MYELTDITRTPNKLAGYYSHFRVRERLLLTGHSHQAWPDCGLEAHTQAWLDAAEHVDRKWEQAFEKADRVRSGFAALLGDEKQNIALGANTHDLIVKFLSALPLRQRPRLVTTDGEYHTIRRQLDRLAEEGIEIVRVPASPAANVPARLIDALDDRTAAVLASSVLYRNGHIVRGLGDVLDACGRRGAELLVDAYHALNVIPFMLRGEGLAGAFVVGGGYKYCQLGEGNCFLRFPPGCALRPVVTGWFSEFDVLEQVHDDGQVRYGKGPSRFAGSTYDPTSHYRAAAVFEFFEQHALRPDFLHEVSRHQVGVLVEAFDGLDLDPKVIRREKDVARADIGGFLSLRSPYSEALFEALRQRGVLTDYRGDFLRLGPAPYLSDAQLGDAMETLAAVVGGLGRHGAP